MPARAKKSYQHIYSRLIELAHKRQKPEADEHKALEHEIVQAGQNNKQESYIMQGMLATVDNKPQSVDSFFYKAAQIPGNKAAAYYNWAISDMLLGNQAKAIEHFSIAVDCLPDVIPYMNDIAANIISLSDDALILKTLHVCAACQIKGQHILELATYVASANIDKPHELCDLLDTILPESELQRRSIEIRQDTWQAFQNSCRELEKLL